MRKAPISPTCVHTLDARGDNDAHFPEAGSDKNREFPQVEDI